MFNSKSIKGTFLITLTLILAACGEVGPSPSLSSSSSSSSSASSTSTSASSQTPIQYTITFKNYDDTVLSSQTVNQGATAVYSGPTPTKPSTEQYTYTFTGWDKTLTNITSSFSTKAQFSQTINYIPITNAEELSNIRNNLSGNYQLMNDIDLESVEWTPIGTDVAPFIGTLDGQEFTISNLKITSSQVYVGLFGYNKGTIKNLKLVNVGINVTGGFSSNIYGGAFIGYNNSDSDLENIHTLSGDIYIKKRGSNEGYAGGIVGYHKSELTIANCSNNLNVVGDLTNATGGLVAQVLDPDNTISKITISESSNTGNINGVMNVAGLMGLVEKTQTIEINESFNKGSIEGLGWSGGLIATAYLYVNSINILNSYNTGIINNKGNVTGGLIGYGNKITIEGSYNLGALQSTHDILGGLVGEGSNYSWNSQSGKFKISNSFNLGQLTGSGRVGGLAGAGDRLEISNSYNNGLISGTGWVGGILGGVNGDNGIGSKIENTFNLASVSGMTYVGGLVGRDSSSKLLIQNSFNNGSINATHSPVGGLVGISSGSITLNKTFNSGSVNGTFNQGGISNICSTGIGGLIGGCFTLTTNFYVYYSLNFGDVFAQTETIFVGGVSGALPNSRDIESTFYSGVVKANNLLVTGVAFGTKVTDLSTFNLEFFTTTLGWDVEIWDFTGLEIANGVYPTLKNMPEIPVEE